MKKINFLFIFILMILPTILADVQYGSGQINISSDSKIVTISELAANNIVSLTDTEISEKTVSAIADYYNIDEEKYLKLLSEELNIQVSKNHRINLLENKYNLTAQKARQLAESLINSNLHQMKYHPIQILIIVSILYFISWYLTKKGKLSIANHRKIWNILLMISFFITAILGFLTTTQITNGWPKWAIRGLHVDPGIIFVVIGTFHTFWHLPYLKRMFKIKNN